MEPLHEEILETDKIRTYAKRLASSLSIIALVLFLTNLNLFLYSLLPFKLLDPSWQLKLLGSLITFCSPALIAGVIGCIALTLNRKDKKIRARAAWISKIAALLSIILLLALPLQLYAGFKVLRAQKAAGAEQLRTSRTLASNVQATTNEQEFRYLVMNLPTQPPLPERFDAPFPVIKERALINLRAGINRLENELQAQNNRNNQLFIAESIRNGVQALLLSLGFVSLQGLLSGKFGPIGPLLYFLE